MRKALIGLILAATAATPLLAQDSGRRGPGMQRDDQVEAREERRQARAERRAERQQAQPQQRTPQAREQRQQQRTERRERRVAREAPPHLQQPLEGVRSERRGQRGDAFRQRILETREASRVSGENSIPRYRRQGERNQQRYEQRLREDRREAREDRRDWRDNRRDWRQDRRGDHRRWARNWRNDRRYDWQRYRYSNRNLFRYGRYYSPFRNHSYSRLSIGLFLGSPFYSNRYWISDPWQYRLPPAYEGTQWVRYYNDVLLVDIYTGEVLDVIHDFFW